MKQLLCGSVVQDCGAVFRAGTEQEILAQVASHARDDHGMEVLPPEVVERARANIEDV